MAVFPTPKKSVLFWFSSQPNHEFCSIFVLFCFVFLRVWYQQCTQNSFMMENTFVFLTQKTHFFFCLFEALPNHEFYCIFVCFSTYDNSSNILKTPSWCGMRLFWSNSVKYNFHFVFFFYFFWCWGVLQARKMVPNPTQFILHTSLVFSTYII